MYVELLINGENNPIQCQQDETIEKVYKRCLSKLYKKPDLNAVSFLYNGKLEEPSKTLIQVINPIDKSRNRLSIIVNKNDDGFIKHNNIICPECLENASVECIDFKYNLKCVNEHIFNNLSPEEFKKSQEIETSRIKCDVCKEKNMSDWNGEVFSRCLECKMNICSGECDENHLENICKKRKSKHKLVNFSLEDDNECFEHKKIFKYVCEKCEKDLCDDCVENHPCSQKKGRKNSRQFATRKFKSYKEYNFEIQEIIRKNEELIKVQKEFNEKINSIINHLYEVKRNLNSFIGTNTEILENFGKSKFKSYKMIQNIKSINIEETINEINLINKNEMLVNQFHDIMILNKRMKYADELTLVYKVKRERNTVKILSKEFVRNNIEKCKLIVNNIEIELKSELDINKYFSKKPEKIIIKLKNVNSIRSMKNAFKDTDLISVPDISKFDTSNIETLEGTFENCRYLEYLPQLEWNVQNVKSTRYMFSGCSKLKNLSFENWKTINNKDMSYMFLDNIALTSIKGLEYFETSNVENMEYIFSGCESLDKIEDISNWNTQNLENIGGMFNGCKKLTELPDISKWNTSNVKDIHEIFYQCQSLTSIPDISKWNTENITIVHGAFYGCKSIMKLPDISKWKLKNVKSLENLFGNCLGLTEIPDISHWDLSNTNDISKMFYNCCSLKNLPDINHWDVSKVEFMNETFNNCQSLKVLPDISNWDTSSLIQMEKLFNGCKEICFLPEISKWTTRKVTNMNSLFNQCCNLKSLPNINLWNTNNLKEANSMFCRCSSLISIPDISKWDVSKITSLKALFCECSNIEHFPDLSHWDMKNVIDVSWMYYGCISIISVPDISKWKLNKKVNKYNMFNIISHINMPDLSMNLINVKNLDIKVERFCQHFGWHIPMLGY